MFCNLPAIGWFTLVILACLPVSSFADDTALARKLLNSQGCKACHSLEGDGGKDAASFEEIRDRLSRAEIRRQLVNQERIHAYDKMPDFSHLSEAEIEALIYFIKPVQ
jgi:hypothetical protein